MILPCSGNELLPHIAHVEHTKGLHLSIIAIEIAQKALAAFTARLFYQFDAPVGDNSCKIRAVKIALIACTMKEEEIRDFQKELESRRSNLKKVVKSHMLLSLKEFRLHHGIEFLLSKDMLFLVQAHFLFVVKHKEVYDQTDPTFLQIIAPIAKGAAKDWIHLIKERLSEASVQFVRQEVEKLPAIRREIVSKMLSPLFIRVYEKRMVAPNFHSMEVVFRLVCRQAIPIIFKSNKGTMFFQANWDDYILKTASEEDMETAAIIVEGKTSQFIKDNLLHNLITKAAQDPQYLEGKRAELIPFEKGAHDPAIAKEKQYFAEMNKAVLPITITHIFCDKVGHHLLAWHGCNWMGDDLNIPSHSWQQKLTYREVCY